LEANQDTEALESVPRDPDPELRSWDDTIEIKNRLGGCTDSSLYNVIRYHFKADEQELLDIHGFTSYSSLL
jgi:hypothetical protein